MREIRIFIASSVEDPVMVADRDALNSYLLSGTVADCCRRNGVTITVDRCEYKSHAMNPNGDKQNDYSKCVLESDLFILLGNQEVGRYTRMEYDVAWKSLREKGHPVILTCFRGKEGDARGPCAAQLLRNIREQGHFVDFYESKASLEDLVARELTASGLDHRLPPDREPMAPDGRCMEELERIPLIANNGRYQQLREEYYICWDAERDTCIAAADDVDNRKKNRAFRSACIAAEDAKEALEEHIKLLLATLATTKRDTPDRYEQEANALLEQGRITEANAVFTTERILMDTASQRDHARELKESFRTTVRQLMHKANMLKMEGRFADMRAPLREAAQLEKEQNLPKTAMREYIDYLYNEHDYTTATPVAKEYLERYMTYEGDQWHIADAANQLGLLTYEAGDFQTAEASFRRAKAIWSVLAQENPQENLPSLARSCNNLGGLLYDTGRSAQAKEEYSQAREIYCTLAQTAPQAHLKDVAGICNNLGILLMSEGQAEAAEQEYRQAMTLFEELSASQPGAYQLDIAVTCNNLGNLLRETGRMAQAEVQYRRAMEIYEPLAASHPGAYLPDLAMTCQNLGILLMETGQMAQAEAQYHRAKDIREVLAAAHPGAYQPDLAMTCINLGLLFNETGRMAEAETEYRCAKEILEPLGKAHPGAYLPTLGIICNNLGLLLWNIGQMETSEPEFRRAAEIFEALNTTHPGAFRLHIATVSNNLGNLLRDIGRMEEAEQEYYRAKDIREALADAQPEAFLPDLAITCGSLGVLLWKTGRTEEAKAEYLRAKGIQAKLAKELPGAYSGDAGNTLLNLGLLYRDQGDMSSAQEAFQAAVEYFSVAVQYNPVHREHLEQAKKALENM